MTQNRVQASWQRAVKAQRDETPHNENTIDLAKPDEAAAELAATLQKIAGNTLFTRIVLFTTNWIIKPIFWLPIKYSCKLAWWSLRNSRTRESHLSERERRIMMWGKYE